MKSVSRKSLLAVLVTALLAVVCAFCAINYVGNAHATYSEQIPSGNITQIDQGFTVLETARVNISGGKKGIKFETEITQKYFNSVAGKGNVKFIAVVTNTVNGNQVAVAFKNLPTFETSDLTETDILNTYLNYDNIGGYTDEQQNAIIAAELKVETYAKITAEGGTVSYEKAANSSNRSMRAVANVAWINYTNVDDEGYDKSELENYFGTAVRDSEINGYTFVDGTIIAKLPKGAPVADSEGNLPTDISVYVGTTPIAAEDIAFDAELGRYKIDYEAAKNLKAGDKNVLSVFKSDGDVYTTNAVQATKLNQANFTDLIDKTSGVYVLTEDIDMSKIDTDSDDATTQSWKNSGKFAGTFDGLGHRIKNLQSASIFNYMIGDSTFKNVAFPNAMPPNAGIIANQVNGDVKVKNVAASLLYPATASTYYICLAGCQASPNAVLTVEDCAVTLVYPTSATLSGILTAQGSNTVKVKNLFYVSTLNVQGENKLEKSHQTVQALKNIDGTADAVPGTDYYKYASVKAMKESFDAPNAAKPSDELMELIDKAGIITEITEENASLVWSSQTGYFYLGGDLDLSSYAAWRGKSTMDYKRPFLGVFDGCGYTITAKEETVHTTSASFFTEIGAGTELKNFVLNCENVTGNNNAALFTYNRGAGVKLSNIVVNINTKYGAYASGIICRGLLNTITIDNVLIYAKSAVAATTANLLFGNNTGGVATLSNFYVVTESNDYTKYSPDDTKMINGTVNHTADFASIDLDAMPSGLAKDFVTAKVTPAA